VREGVKDRSDFSLLVGPDELLAEAVLMGGHGGMAGGSNLWPRLFVALYEAAVTGDLNRVVALQQRVVQFDTAIYRSANPLRGLKCALSLLGMCGDELTLPLQPYSQQERDQVQKYLQTVDVLKDPA
jgi:4-hydroxy-tetrahydrodipicolinate synthase